MQFQYNLKIKITLKGQDSLGSYYDILILDPLSDQDSESYLYLATINDLQLSLILPVEVRSYLRKHDTGYAIIESIPSYKVVSGTTIEEEENAN